MQSDASGSAAVDAYIAGFPEDVQAILRKVRATIRMAAPGAEEAIAYGIPTFRLNGNLVHFAAFRNHIGFYPAPSAIEKFAKELSAREMDKMLATNDQAKIARVTEAFLKMKKFDLATLREAAEGTGT